MIFASPGSSSVVTISSTQYRRPSAGYDNSAGVLFEMPVYASVVGTATAGTNVTCDFSWQLKRSDGTTFLTYSCTAVLKVLRTLVSSVSSGLPTAEIVSFNSSWSGSASVVSTPEAQWPSLGISPYSHIEFIAADKFTIVSDAFQIVPSAGIYAEFSFTTSHTGVPYLNSQTFPNFQFAVKPTANFTAIDDDGTVTFDASTTLLGGQPTTTDSYNYINTYGWDFGDSTAATVTTNTTTHEYSDETTYNVTLVVTDKYGSFNSTSQNVPVTPAGFIGTLINHTNTLHSAVKSGSDIQCYRFTDGTIGGKETMALISNAKNPRLSSLSNGVMYVTATDRSDGKTYDWKSTDGLKTVVKLS